MNDVASALLSRIHKKTVKVAVIGLGYVGLPFLCEKAKVGLEVVGLDRSEERVAQVMAGDSYINDVASSELAAIVARGNVKATTDTSVLGDVDVIVICVPTPLDKNLCPDLHFVRSVSESIAQYIKPGQLISLESTTYPGTTEEVITPILESSGLKAGQDFFVAHSPERVDPGNKRYTTKNTNKVVGADDADSLAVAEAFYKLAIEHVVPVSQAKTAEMVKVYENTYRAVNIALANEIAVLCDKMGIDVWEMLDAAFTKPFGIMPFYPGPGVGGHCIPIDPHYLEWKAKEYNFNTHFISLAGEVNRSMPQFVVDKLARLLNKQKKAVNGAKVVIIGMAYKSDLPDYRESPAMHVYELLQASGADLMYYDPFVPEIAELGAKSITLDALEGADAAVIITAHASVDHEALAAKVGCLLDTRNAIKGDYENVEKL